MGFFQGTQERVRNRRGKRAIGVRATEGLLFFFFCLFVCFCFFFRMLPAKLVSFFDGFDSYEKMPGKMSVMIRF